MKKIFLILAFILLLAQNALATATEFVATVKGSGGDYTTLQGAETGLQNDLTAGTIKVFSISAYSTPTIVAGDSVTGVTSTATGTMVLVNAARTQVLIKSISGTFQSGEVVKKTSDPAVNITLSNAGDSPIIGIECYASASPDGAVVVNGWTTSAANYIHIYTPVTERHKGVWDALKYYITSTSNIVVDVVEGHVRIDGLQIYQSSNSAGSPRVIRFYEGASTSGKVFYLTNNIIRGNTASTQLTYSGIQFYEVGGSTTGYIYNNLIYDVSSSGDTSERGMDLDQAGGTYYVYNNTFIDITGTGLRQGGQAPTIYAKNNLFSSVTTAAANTFAAGTDYNSTNNASMNYTVTGGGNTHDVLNAVYSFVSSGSDNFHLTSTDAGARNLGVDLSASLTTDIDGDARPGESVWDIGSDEYIPITINHMLRFSTEGF